MLDNQNIVDGKIELDGLIHKYLESNGFRIVVDPAGNVGVEGDNLPSTEEEIYNNIVEFMIAEYKNSTEEEIMALSNSKVKVDVVYVNEMLYNPFEEEQPVVLPAPVKHAPVKPEPEAQEGFFSSYYNWIFGTPKEDKKPEQSSAPKPSFKK
jgi:hypothetical protein